MAQWENDGHLCVSRQGKHCLTGVETQDISRSQQIAVPHAASLRESLLELDGHFGHSCMDVARFLHTSAFQPALWPGRQPSINGPPGLLCLVVFSQWGTQQQMGRKRVKSGRLAASLEHHLWLAVFKGPSSYQVTFLSSLLLSLP